MLESVKAAADIYTPVSGTVTKVNSELEEKPEWVNNQPYIKGEDSEEGRGSFGEAMLSFVLSCAMSVSYTHLTLPTIYSV